MKRGIALGGPIAVEEPVTDVWALDEPEALVQSSVLLQSPNAQAASWSSYLSSDIVQYAWTGDLQSDLGPLDHNECYSALAMAGIVIDLDEP